MFWNKLECEMTWCQRPQMVNWTKNWSKRSSLNYMQFIITHSGQPPIIPILPACPLCLSYESGGTVLFTISTRDSLLVLMTFTLCVKEQGAEIKVIFLELLVSWHPTSLWSLHSLHIMIIGTCCIDYLIYCDVPGSPCLSKKGESNVRFVPFLTLQVGGSPVGLVHLGRAGPPVSLPGRFVGDPTSLARDNIDNLCTSLTKNTSTMFDEWNPL